MAIKILRKVNIIPGTYWLQRYAYPTARTLLFHILATHVYILLAVFLIKTISKIDGGILFSILKLYGLIWLSYISLYEIGYFINDFWSTKREKKYQTRQKEIYKPSSDLLASAIIMRLLFSTIILFLLYNIMSVTTFLQTVFIILLIQIIFLLHNLLLYPYRILTFGLLYLGKFLLLFPLFSIYFSLEYKVLYLAAILPPVIGFTVKYGIKGVITTSRNFGLFSAKTGNFILRLAALFALFEIPLFILLFSAKSAFVLVFLVIYLSLIDLLFTFGRFILLCFKALNSGATAYHIHTCFSHDATISPKAIINYAKQNGIKRIYVTDHAEDFNPKKFRELTTSFKRLKTKSNIECFIGLEYDVLGQHFLAIGLEKFVEVDNFDVKELEKLKCYSEKILWAHPHFKIRNWIFDSAYRKKWYYMMRSVDGMEVINLKGFRGFDYTWRHLFLSFLSVVLEANKFLFVGIDAHDFKDLSSCSYSRKEIIKELLKGILKSR